MQRSKRMAGPALAITASLFLAACETLGIATKQAPPASVAEILRDVPKVSNSTHSPCWQQREIAAQRSYIESGIEGKPKRYHAECTDDAKPAAKPESKTT